MKIQSVYGNTVIPTQKISQRLPGRFSAQANGLKEVDDINVPPLPYGERYTDLWLNNRHRYEPRIRAAAKAASINPNILMRLVNLQAKDFDVLTLFPCYEVFLKLPPKQLDQLSEAVLQQSAQTLRQLHLHFKNHPLKPKQDNLQTWGLAIAAYFVGKEIVAWSKGIPSSKRLRREVAEVLGRENAKKLKILNWFHLMP